ncbi:sulfotransferase [Rhodopirellula sp. MGV]|uniref:sulfotransferase n=1 Tax=Rhodopirellula sp. MGV TaxID=2023130 RepID=UPI000B961692|nr:sulfotransferase [Rhodopirellula sp. MGV]OYP33021.1 hypothetical protein CGZ80_19220 [Rhodopirellula sp. MGV]PNY35316.1 hypothetical protein C2E31_17460 [Rhodopirellula baltica]
MTNQVQNNLPTQPVILAFGMPRSGTSWIGKLLDSHPATYYLHEPDSVMRLEGVPTLPLTSELDKYGELIRTHLESIFEVRSPRVTCKMPQFRKSYRNFLGNQFAIGSAYVCKALSKHLSDVQVPRFAAIDHPGLVIVWKSIQSAGRIELVNRNLPNSKALLILRHPCGQIASLIRGRSFMSKKPASEKYGLFEEAIESGLVESSGLTIESLKQMTPVQRLAWQWRIMNTKACHDLDSVGGQLCVYEQIAKDIGAMEEQFKALGLDFHAQTQQFLKSSSEKQRAAYFSVYKQSASVADAWMDEMAAEDIRDVMEIVEPSEPWQRLAATID